MSATPLIVLGGAGFIGSHCCKHLAARGYLPVSVDNLSTGHADAVKWGPLERVDVRDAAALKGVIRKYGARTVLHFAAFAVVSDSIRAPDSYYDNNVGGMIGVLAAMKAADADRLVFSSSCATYGIPPKVPIDETLTQNPINPYGWTKLIGEQMIYDQAAAYGLNFTILRYFNAAGADPEGELAERHDPETRLIPLALMAASGMGPPLRIFGTDFDTPDGTAIRDYIHVTDLAEAHYLALRHLETGGDNLVLNLGTAHGLSVREICGAVERITRALVPLVEAPRRAGDPPVLIADASEARRRLGFHPRLSDIETIIRHAAPHYGHKIGTTEDD
ncbi:UDP-glucose 4-epimerase GalE [Aliiruegeria lutimaris]|uniref:UDP-glucose 4-epimerase n=1 Tax=Aliiruegeria lutimaris TaxID=571298 RepID=A0A1G8VDJ4_9RHOB|nr:UDP-glucose 4-epimerase GalE [Aliiruegeria lutimaris]SDJ64113.1 UDP-arabinose 4-epimerase [Aliiruegeria lutimaris]